VRRLRPAKACCSNCRVAPSFGVMTMFVINRALE
jgi:hypothetical protein